MKHRIADDDPAFRLLVRLCGDAAFGRPSPAALALAAALQDWPGFLTLVARHRVFGLVHWLATQAPAAFPGDVRAALAERAVRISRHNLLMAANTARLQQLFDAAGIPAIFFKGVLLGERAYGTLAVKHGKDIDFLVPEADVERTLALLNRQGYDTLFPHRPLTPRRTAAMLRFAKEALMVHRETGVVLEPHWRLAHNMQLLDAAPLRAAAGRWQAIGDTPIATLHPDDEFAYLCLHGAQSGWFRLKWLADIHALIARASLEERTRLYAHAEARGLGPSVLFAFGMLNELFEMPLPAHILQRVETRHQRQLRAGALTCLREMRASGMPLPLVRTALLHAASFGPAQFVGEILCWATASVDAVDLPLPRTLHWLYWGLRVPLWALRRTTGRGASALPQSLF